MEIPVDWGRVAALSGGRFLTITTTKDDGLMLVFSQTDWRRPQAQILLTEGDLQTLENFLAHFRRELHAIKAEATKNGQTASH